MAKKQQEQQLEQPTPVTEIKVKKQRVTKTQQLEKQLKDAEMKAIAYSTMVDIAEKEFNIPIKKKLNTKPSQQ